MIHQLMACQTVIYSGRSYRIRRFSALSRRQRHQAAGTGCNALGQPGARDMPHNFRDLRMRMRSSRRRDRPPQRCIASTREALTAAVGYILEQGQTQPAPAKQFASTLPGL